MQIVRPEAAAKCKAVIFAPGGAGKTHLLGTAQEDPRTSPMLLLDFEGGVMTLSGLDIDIAPIRSWDDYNQVFEILASGKHWKLPGSSLSEGEEYRSLGIDSATETHKWALLSILAKEGDTRKNPDLLEMRDYGTATVQMRRLLREFRDLPMHVFYTAHSKEVEEARIGKVKVPDMSGQMAEELVGLMDVAGYLAQTEDEEEVNGEVRIVTKRLLLLQSQAYPKFRVKARSPWDTPAPDDIEDPTVASLLDALGYSTKESQNGSSGEGKKRRSSRRKKEETQEQPEAEEAESGSEDG